MAHEELDTSRPAFREGANPRVQRLGRWLGVALFALFAFTPFEGLDVAQRRAAAVTALVATLWLTQGIPLAAASLLPAALFPLLGVLPARDASAAYMDDLVMLFLGAFLVASGLEVWGVHRRVALTLVAPALPSSSAPAFAVSVTASPSAVTAPTVRLPAVLAIETSPASAAVPADALTVRSSAVAHHGLK